jgi:hypothetical protein
MCLSSGCGYRLDAARMGPFSIYSDFRGSFFRCVYLSVWARPRVALKELKQTSYKSRPHQPRTFNVPDAPNMPVSELSFFRAQKEGNYEQPQAQYPQQLPPMM